jgi:Tol biopolymer transport system component
MSARTLVPAVALLLAGCGGGGSGGGGPTGGAPGTFTAGVAYLADAEVDERVELYTADLDGDGARKVSAPLPPNSVVRWFEWSPDRSRLAYMVDPVPAGYGAVALYAAFPDGSPPTLLATASASDALLSASWSPDSQRLAYGIRRDSNPAVDGDERSELWTVSVQGGPGVRVSGAPPAGLVYLDWRWSPDSSRLAYISDEEVAGTYELYTVAATGGDRRTLPGPVFQLPDGIGGSFEWSPTGDLIAYTADLAGDRGPELFVAAPDGTGGVTIYPQSPAGAVTRFAWAPDGSRLALSVIENGFVTEEADLYTAPPSGGLTKVSTSALGNHRVFEFAWSPDSSSIAFAGYSLRPGMFIGAAYPLVVPAAGGSNEQLGIESGGFGLHWAPDGSRVAWAGFSEIHTGAVGEAVAHLASGALTTGAWSPDSSRMAYAAIFAEQEWVYVSHGETSWGQVRITPPFLYDVVPYSTTELIQWTPDSQRVLFVAAVSGLGVSELFSASAEGGDLVPLSGPLTFEGAVSDFKVR